MSRATIPRRGSIAAAGRAAGLVNTILGTTGIQHLFAFTEAAGPPLDLKGSATGSAGAGVTFAQTGLTSAGTSIGCNGTNAMVTLSSLTVTSAPFSYCLWFNRAGPPNIGDTTYETLFASAAGNRFLVKSDGTGVLDQTSGNSINTAVTLTQGVTYSIFYTGHPTFGRSIYINNSQIGSQGGSANNTPKASMFVGAYEATPTNYPWNGRLAMFGVWNVEVSSADRAAIVAAQ